MTIEIKLSRIYQASHDDLPAQAAGYVDQATKVAGATETLVAQLALAGNHPIAKDLGTLGEELFFRLRGMARTMNDSATALDLIAADFAKTDADAADWIAHHQKWLTEHPLGSGTDNPALPAAPEI